MANRNPKRQRKKDAAEARRQARLEMLQRRRKTRMYTLAAITAALVVGGGTLAVLASLGGDPEPSPTPGAPTPSPAGSPAPIACSGRYPKDAGVKKPTFKEAADQKLNARKTYLLRLDTSCGRVDIKLAVDKAPKTANSIVFLTREKFFDGLEFHRLVKDFVIQGGDPSGNGTGGPGYKVVEAPPRGQKYTKGVVAMAKAQNEAAGTSGSQFYIVVGEDSGLTPDYALLGTVVSGMDVLDKFNELAPSESGRPVDGPPPQKIYIEKATIVEQ